MPVLELQDLNVGFPTKRGLVRAVRGVSLRVESGETYGLVGESGCGKSTVALAVMHYLSPGAQTSGTVRFKDQDVTRMSRRQLRPLRGNRMAMVYQDPQSSLNPSLTIERQLSEVIFAHEPATRGEARHRILEMLELVRMPDPAYILNRYPHQLSGGMQQRVVIGASSTWRSCTSVITWA
jgi:peptide/nickel transport system ATP-binding protein